MQRTAPALAALMLVGTGTAAVAVSNPAERPTRTQCELAGPYDYPQGSEPVRLDPHDFTTRIDNPYWPMQVGTVWRLAEREGSERLSVRIRVTGRTTMIEGIRARVVRDTVRDRDGELVEDTRDWYAQDSGGNIWYLGEATTAFEDGKPVGREGSWRHGRDGAFAGVLLPADPQPGCSYREEFRRDHAEDRAQILSVDEQLSGPTGFHRDVLQTSNTTPLEPRLLENKFYARGVGPVLAVDLSPSLSSETLVEVRKP